MPEVLLHVVSGDRVYGHGGVGRECHFAQTAHLHITSGVKRAALISSAVSTPSTLLDSGVCTCVHEANDKADAIIMAGIAFFHHMVCFFIFRIFAVGPHVMGGLEKVWIHTQYISPMCAS